MSCCLLLRSAMAAPTPPRRRFNGRACGRTVLAMLSALTGTSICRGLRDMLDAIPDNNDDFTFH
ncbi:MAG TPA: hypothetical protein VGN31_08570 [Paraburkholderia sp.]